MRDTTTEIFIDPKSFGYTLRHARGLKSADGQAEVVRFIFDRFSPRSGETLPSDAYLHITPEDAHSLMDQLWRLGIRPSSGLDNSQELFEATKLHLVDLRKILLK